jgi:hypothetical protein
MHDKQHHKREIIFLVTLMVLFGVIFLFAFLDLKRGIAIMGVLPAQIEDIIIMLFSVAAIMKCIWHLMAN